MSRLHSGERLPPGLVGADEQVGVERAFPGRQVEREHVRHVAVALVRFVCAGHLVIAHDLYAQLARASHGVHGLEDLVVQPRQRRGRESRALIAQR